MIPNSLFYAHDQLDGPIVSEAGDERFDQWLECADSDVQVVVTHPSGIAHHKRELYKNAARSFAQGLTGTQDPRTAREPKLIPEALAAAYFGISRSPARQADTQVFACIDIGASTVDASLIEVKMRHDSIESWKVFAHFGATIGGANLDEALLAIVIQNLRELFSSTDPIFEDLEIDHRFLRDEALKTALLPRILEAKRALSENLMQYAGSDGEYRWAEEGPGSTFAVELNDILRSASPGHSLEERDTAIPGTQDKVHLRVRNTQAGGQAVWIEISPDLLDAGSPVANPSRSNPQTVARTLGYAVPAMLIREARRLNLGDPQWVVTGRASLWPSVFTGIGRTAQMLGQPASAVPQKPFSADDMKNATVYGAARLATAGLEITDGADHSYALVLHDDGRGVVSEIEYLDTRSRSEGNKSVRFLPNRWLSRVLPGLDDVGSDTDITRDEIIRLFGIFGQKVVVDQSQVKPGGLAEGRTSTSRYLGSEETRMSSSPLATSSSANREVAWREPEGHRMAVIGIEFTSAIAQVIFTLLLLAVVAAAVWLVQRLRRSEANLETIRRENAKLRNEVGNITGWTANGRLPEDWQEKLRTDKAVSAGSAPAVSAEAARQPVLMAAHHALVSVEPPHFASSDSADEISRAHKRIVDLVEGLAAERIDPVPALANGDMDKLFCLWRRLEGYFPDRAETDAYGLAAYAVLELLKRRQVQVKAAAAAVGRKRQELRVYH